MYLLHNYFSLFQECPKRRRLFGAFGDYWGRNVFSIGVPQRLAASSGDKLYSARRLESNDESLMHSGTTDGDMPNGVCQQKDLCATTAVSKEAQSLESNRHGDWPTRRGPLAMETDGPRPRRGDPGPIGTRSPGRRRVRVPDGFHLTKVESSGVTRLARNPVNPRGEWYINPPRVTRLDKFSSLNN